MNEQDRIAICAYFLWENGKFESIHPPDTPEQSVENWYAAERWLEEHGEL